MTILIRTVYLCPSSLSQSKLSLLCWASPYMTEINLFSAGLHGGGLVVVEIHSLIHLK